MKTLNTLTKIGIGLFWLGAMLLAYNMFKIYEVVGACNDSANSCPAYASWQLLGHVGRGIMASGAIIVTIDQIKNRTKH